MRSWDDFQPCLWQQNRTFLLRSQDNFELFLWQQKKLYLLLEVRTISAGSVVSKPNVFDGKSGNLQPCMWIPNWIFRMENQDISSQKKWAFQWELGTISSNVCGDKKLYFWQEAGTSTTVFVETKINGKSGQFQPDKMEVFNENSGWIQAICGDKNLLLDVRTISSSICSDKTRYFWQEIWTFPARCVETKPNIFDGTSGQF